MSLSRNIYELIAAERLAQDAEWGGPEHDDQHSDADWTLFIGKHFDRARLQVTGPAGAVNPDREPVGELRHARYDCPTAADAFDASMIKVVALGIACLESRHRRACILEAVASLAAEDDGE